MVFNSYAFIFVFLPICLVGYHFATKLGPRTATAWLALASFAFYAHWTVAFIPMLVVSILCNFATGKYLLRIFKESDAQDRPPPRRASLILAIGVICNLAPLFYFKYLMAIEAFFAELRGLPSGDATVILPLGISFYTFTQIGYLIDCRQGEAKDLDLLRYALFVTFFPHLASGPLLHVREIAPQLLDSATFRLTAENLARGAVFFVIGLSKKVILADPLARQVGLGFSHPELFGTLSTWGYVLAYSMELYFDFSGYSDMAIGLAAMFGLKFPLNFNSPYKCSSIIDFWQRYHMTLTRYLTLLVYNPIALFVARRRQRRGLPPFRRGAADFRGFLEGVAAPTFVTMTLAGVWHGAGLQFFVFGLLHASYLTINQAWRAYGPKSWNAAPAPVRVAIVGAQVLATCLIVFIGNVFFRASSVVEAATILGGLVGLNGWASPEDVGMAPPYLDLAVRFFILWALPNTQQFAEWLMKAAAAPRLRLSYAASLAGGALLGCDLIMLQDSRVFLYFQF
ncbi:MAG TPA: MBOAT family O-acyltransferase [Methylocystis sp.]|nr:MBOAT family O-acyltransferase [Methylocystis sp.]